MPDRLSMTTDHEEFLTHLERHDVLRRLYEYEKLTGQLISQFKQLREEINGLRHAKDRMKGRLRRIESLTGALKGDS